MEARIVPIGVLVIRLAVRFVDCEEVVIRLAGLSLVLIGSLAGPALSAEQVLTLDPEATEITFLLEATGHDVHGQLFLESGEIRFDMDSGAASGEIAVDARKAGTGNRKRDKTMHRKVLASERFPLFVFRPTGVEGESLESGASQLTLSGTLDIHGEEHPISIPIQFEHESGRVSSNAVFVVPYVDWGMHRPNILFLKVAPAVEVRIKTEGNLSVSSGLP